MDLERRHGGRLGVAMLDTGNGSIVAYRGNERFPLCSTHKALTVTFALARVDRNVESLSRQVIYGPGDLVPYSPVTSRHTGPGGLSIGELCDAAMTLSDNTAANLLLDSFGGPAALTLYLRSLGDNVTRLDRREPDLNDATPGDLRDTTTPEAMLHILREAVLGTALSSVSRDYLIKWLVANQTGFKRLKAGLPSDWTVGDKTGSGAHGTTNDVAVMWPPGRSPIIVTAYYTEAEAGNETIVASVGGLVTLL